MLSLKQQQPPMPPLRAGLYIAPVALAGFMTTNPSPVISLLACAATGVFSYVSYAAELHENSSVGNRTPPTSIDLQREQDSMAEAIPLTDSDSSSDENEEVETIKKEVNLIPLVWREQRGKSKLVEKYAAPSTRTSKKPVTYYTMDEVAKHDKKDDCWIVVESKVYDITNFLIHHPGGWLPLLNMSGKDCTDAFANYHPAHVYDIQLPRYYKGEVTDMLDGEFEKEFRGMRSELLRRGLFETNNYYYYLKSMWLAVFFTSAFYLSTHGNYLVGAVIMAVFWQQLAFLGHDIGHNAISHSKTKDTTVGIIVGNTLGGISLGWWKHSHNVHHLVCNSVENDPDIQHMPLFAVSDEIFDKDKLREAGTLCEENENNGFWSTYHEKWIHPDIVSKFLVCHQHYLYYPIMCVARFNLYIQGLIFVATAKKQDNWHAERFQKLELVTLLVFFSWMAYLLTSLESLWERAQWLLLSHSLAGVLHVQICISHFAMPTYHGKAYNGEADNWFRMQVATTMNVDCPRVLDFVHGGLQFQIEHHLFPRLPRHNLREARELVKPFCEKWNIHYHEPGFVAANVELVEGLKAVAYKCRKYGLEGIGGFEESQIFEGLNARG